MDGKHGQSAESSQLFTGSSKDYELLMVDLS